MLGETLRNQANYDNDNQQCKRQSGEYVNDPSSVGSNIDVVTRAFYLLEALDEFSKASKNNGHYFITEQNERGNKRKISNLSKSVKEHEHNGVIAFLNANNLDPYANNSIQKELLIANTVNMARGFKKAYIGSENKDRRDLLRKRLMQQIETFSPLEQDLLPESSK